MRLRVERMSSSGWWGASVCERIGRSLRSRVGHIFSQRSRHWEYTRRLALPETLLWLRSPDQRVEGRFHTKSRGKRHTDVAFRGGALNFFSGYIHLMKARRGEVTHTPADSTMRMWPFEVGYGTHYLFFSFESVWRPFVPFYCMMELILYITLYMITCSTFYVHVMFFWFYVKTFSYILRSGGSW